MWIVGIVEKGNWMVWIIDKLWVIEVLFCGVIVVVFVFDSLNVFFEFSLWDERIEVVWILELLFIIMDGF